MAASGGLRNKRLMYAKRTLSKTALSSKRLVYVRHTFSKSSVVSSTRDATFFENMLSRLRKTTTLGGNVESRPRKPSPAESTRARKKSWLVYAKRIFTESSLKISPLVYAQRTLPNASVVSSTRDATFFDKLRSRARGTPTLGGKHEGEPSPDQPSPGTKQGSEKKLANRCGRLSKYFPFSVLPGTMISEVAVLSAPNAKFLWECLKTQAKCILLRRAKIPTGP